MSRILFTSLVHMANIKGCNFLTSWATVSSSRKSWTIELIKQAENVAAVQIVPASYYSTKWQSQYNAQVSNMTPLSHGLLRIRDIPCADLTVLSCCFPSFVSTLMLISQTCWKASNETFELYAKSARSVLTLIQYHTKAVSFTHSK
jgi:hypothetical protein